MFFLKKKSRIFKNLIFLQNLKPLKHIVFLIFIIHKPSLWSRDVPQKIWARFFQPFNVYWIQTNRQTPRQTDRQAKFIYRLFNFTTFHAFLIKIYI